jgi:biotin-dependent carboxylase-like uncharacterized protein
VRSSLVVVDAGPSLLVQDGGRRGWAHLGVPPSGALDPGALALANRLVGNAETAAGLEVLLGGVRLRAESSARVAVTGAPMEVVVGGQPRPWGEALSVRAGDELELRPGPTGLRSWLALAGGVAAEVVLGSRSSDTLSRLGPPALVAGDRVVGGPVPARPGTGAAVPRRVVGLLRLRLGPRDGWFEPAAVERLASTTYTVEPDSDRVGLRLRAVDGTSLPRSRHDELPSEGLLTGAVQVPASGQPLVFLADHPVTGGYPVVGVVDRDDLWQCAQLRPGEQVRFGVVR